MAETLDNTKDRVETLVRAEELALEKTIQRLDAENSELQSEVADIGEQNRVLKDLIREQKDYLRQAEVLIEEIESRKKVWRERYQRAIGEVGAKRIKTGSR